MNARHKIAVAMIGALGFSGLAFAEISGSETASWSNKAEACSAAKKAAAREADRNARREVGMYSEADVRTTIGECNCSSRATSGSTADWTCEASWNLHIDKNKRR